jgi:hypothetical protein
MFNSVKAWSSSSSMDRKVLPHCGITVGPRAEEEELHHCVAKFAHFEFAWFVLPGGLMSVSRQPSSG